MTADDPARAADDLVALVIEATAHIADSWFRLRHMRSDPRVIGSVYRERVYCYELYHQLRVLMENGYSPSRFVLSAEVDKSGMDAVIRGGDQKPDLIWHVPASGLNAVVMEVKASDGLAISRVRKDFETLNAFLTAPSRSYQRAIFHVYGDTTTADRLENIASRVANIVAMEEQTRQRVHVMWHRVVGTAAADLGAVADMRAR